MAFLPTPGADNGVLTILWSVTHFTTSEIEVMFWFWFQIFFVPTFWSLISFHSSMIQFLINALSPLSLSSNLLHMYILPGLRLLIFSWGIPILI